LKLAHYVRDGSTRVGVVHEERIFDFQDVAKRLQTPAFGEMMTIDAILASGRLSSLLAQENLTGNVESLPVESVTLRSPILNPEKILLMAVNYHSHSKEWSQKDSTPTEPYLFTKFRNSLIGPGDSILIPKISQEADWEVELAVIIGKAGKNIPKKDAMNYVAGYAVSNDISFRDWQFSTRQADGTTKLGLNWVKGKGLDSSFPLGPWLVTVDELTNPHDLEISLTVNGKTRQQSTTGDMVFRIDSIIEYASKGMTLRPGDIISTGTPEGVAAFTGGPYLKDGDILEGTIARIGTLRNPVRAD
jgi:2-keto-4-pentenoate hydratase/2-oxohepta-3-ene-1,7-dioic acid hydratase in catechol pathway